MASPSLRGVIAGGFNRVSALRRRLNCNVLSQDTPHHEDSSRTQLHVPASVRGHRRR